MIVSNLEKKRGDKEQETYHEINVVVLAEIHQEALNLAHLDLLCILRSYLCQQVDSILQIEYGSTHDLDVSRYFFMAFVATPM